MVSKIEVVKGRVEGTILLRALNDEVMCESIEVMAEAKQKGSHIAARKIEHMRLPDMGCSFEE